MSEKKSWLTSLQYIIGPRKFYKTVYLTDLGAFLINCPLFLHLVMLSYFAADY